MDIRCWKCGASFAPKGLLFRRKTVCPDCGCRISFGKIRLIRNFNVILAVLVLTAVGLYACFYDIPGLHDKRYENLLISAGGPIILYFLSYPLDCFLYNRFSRPKLRRDGDYPDERRLTLDACVIFFVFLALLIAGYFLFVR